ncbi:tannase/feruloyl esterase family alpha/beta hydrolase [Vannielia litorea]|uniref:tannase/feruloyl esterase family alpha/beta hydrolase n=1 Tax=Vannielia litorea TaxID=1217970 RepID=UPI001C9772CF|nr:tannase/feruloyl esterase family alpha/beta hydrolase [Vannielia litorea]MBY6047702.1 tannase/feruloyl esterase family alpha/beta hydrolase [Vannielia litorea]MBY6075116.1 tannase/feruloyl esterase family alpha/beta hydrolase [Vannielia litorea]
MKRTRLTAAALLLAGSPGLATAAPDAKGCAALRGLSVAPEAIGLPSGGADIHTVTFIETPTPYCQVNGAIDPVDPSAPDINFQVNLPAEWNGKALHYGGGGYNGALVTGLDQAKFNPASEPTPLEKGYATWGSDSGHQSGSSLSGAFMLNEESLRNFGGEQLKKTRDAAMAALEAFYGEAPSRTYFQGSSQGGHEAMIAIQRWPDDYDGAVVVHPANPVVGLQLSGNRAGQAFYAEGAYMSPADVELLNGAVFAACDSLDGAEDRLIGNIAACEAAFDVQSLACEGDTAQEGQCLTQAQITALDVIATRTPTPPLQGGAEGFSGWPIYLAGDLYGLWGMGKSPELTNPPTPVANFGLAVLADPMIRYGVLADPDANTIEFDAKAHAARLTELSEITDAVAADMSGFADKGAKVLLMHGITDFAIPFGNTVDWYERVVAEMGEEATRDFLRFWLVPGFGHGSGEFQMRWSSLDALDAWVEEGTAPEGLVMTDAAEATAGRSRPMCEYPAFARLNEGANDLNAAASYSCVTE